MNKHLKTSNWLALILLCIPLLSFAAIPVKSMVIFGDSLSDNGNTTHLLKSLRQEESPAFLVAPFKIFVLNKMTDYANDYHVPQTVLDAGIGIVTGFFDRDLAPFVVNLVGKIRLVPILPGKPYWNSRFSNGPVWNEYLAQMWSIPTDDKDLYVNRAFGGGWAATYDYQVTVWNLIRHPLGTVKSLIVGKLIPPSLGLTVQAYLLENQQLDDNTVYFVSAGMSDYLNVLQFEDNYNPAIMRHYVNNVVDSLGLSVSKLADKGAKYFVIMGLVHVGDMPKFNNTLDRDILNAASKQHNQRLQTQMEEWKKNYPQADFLFVNTQDFVEKTTTNPAQYGFTNVNNACIDIKYPMFDALTNSPFIANYVMQYAQTLNYKDEQFTQDTTNYQVCESPKQHLYWDEIHPSTRTHGYLAAEICRAMKKHGYEVSCALSEPAA